MSAQSAGCTVVVAGDRVIDNHLYEGDRPHPAMLDRLGVRLVRRHGGPVSLCELLEALAERTGASGVAVRLGDDQVAADGGVRHAFATWRPCQRSDADRRLVWRASLLGYGADDPAAGQPGIRDVKPFVRAGAAPIDVLVLDDAGHGFRMAARAPSWLLGDPTEAPRWIVLKTSDPVARGDLWSELSTRHADRLACVVSVDDIRRGQAIVSKGLSWERTVDGILTALREDPTLATLAACRHLVVTLSRDGALWIDNAKPEASRAVLFFDPSGAEGGWDALREGATTGFLTIMTAAVALHLATATGVKTDDEGFAAAVEAGLHGMRDLSENGHGPVGAATDATAAPDGFPTSRVAGVMAAGGGTPWARVRISRGHNVADGRWMVLEAAQSPLGTTIAASLLGPARRIVTHGPQSVLKDYPHAVFRRLTVVDRREIEALRGIRASMLAYRDGKSAAKPLSVAVFGPPGAGKSFGVRQLSDDVFGKRAWLEFNLSQFSGPGDLMGPFHQVRDLVLDGVTPVVFWDEFDSQQNKWLQFLLAPMQDGRFQDGPLNHAIGKCVFVFAGGTSATFSAYAPRDGDPDMAEFRLRKGPDFVSRLDAYYDVVGPNRRRNYTREGGRIASAPDASDVSYPVRRALLVRNTLVGDSTDTLDIDTDLLNALLLTREYRHGSRSLEKLVQALRPAGGGAVQRSALPPPDRLQMLVDTADFLDLLNCNGAYRIGQAVEDQASKIHAAYLEHARLAGETVEKRLSGAYETLGPAEKEDNRAAARRTVDVLALIGMGVEAGDGRTAVDPADYAALVEHHIERLAEAEHDGWMRHRLLNGWELGGERNFDAKTHPSLKAYAELEPTDQKKDRLMVRDYARRISESRFRIVWLAAPEALPDDPGTPPDDPGEA